MRRIVIPVLLALAALTGAVPLFAHHSFAAEFDDQKPVKMTGTITKVEWQNPHIWFYLDVKNPDGSVTNWGFAGGAPGQLMRRGITKDQLKIGETVVVEGFRSKDGSNNASGGRSDVPRRPQRPDRGLAGSRAAADHFHHAVTAQP